MRLTAYGDTYSAAYGAAFYASIYPALDPAELPRDAFTPAAPPPAAMSPAASSAAAVATGVQRTADTQRTGRSGQVQGSVSDTEAALALPAPSTERIFLVVQNTHDTQALYFAYDQAPTAESFTIQPGETRTFSTFIPQNDIWLLGAGADTTYVIEFANKKAE